MEDWKKNVDTSKMSPKEVREAGLEGARRPPGQHPGGVLHQQGGVGIKKAGSYPVALAGLLVAVGVATLTYYQQTKPSENKSPRHAS